MGDEAERSWTVGGLSRGPDGLAVSKDADLTGPRFERLERDARFVRDLAADADLRRAVEAVGRWDEVLARADDELADGGTLSPATAAAAALDLRSAANAADRLERALLEKIEAAPAASAATVHAFHEARYRMRASSPHLLAHELARRAATDGVSLVLADGVVRFEGVAGQSARDVVVALFGFLLALVGIFLEAFEEPFEEVAGEIEALAGQVSSGTPSLIAYELDPDSGEPKRFQITDLPLGEVAALRQFYRDRGAAETHADLAHAAAALARATERTHLRVGDVEVASAYVGGGATTTLNYLPSAKIRLDLDLLGSAPLDYWGPVHYALELDGDEHELFAGAVQQVDLNGDVASLACEGAADLIEHNPGGILAADVNTAELVLSLILQAGLPTDIIPMAERPDEPPEETFDVLVPVRGVEVGEPVDVGSSSIVPASRGLDALGMFPIEGEAAERLAADFSDATSYGFAEARAGWLHDAEDAGATAIETSVAWLVTRGRYGFARLPDGRGQAFSRQESLRGPDTGPTVIVRGRTSGRRWLRWRGPGDPVARTLAAGSPSLEPELPHNLGPRERQALLALRRAASEAIAESQVQALWEAIELYVGRTKLSPLFAPEELDRLRAAIPSDLKPAQAEAVAKAIDNLNDAPLVVRLRERLESDGVPLSESERKLLFKTLRRARNATVHGRSEQRLPSREQIQRGVSLVARMLVHRIAKDAGLDART